MLEKEPMQAIASYSTGGLGVLLGTLPDMQTLTLFFGLLVLVVRLAYDTLRFFRRLRNKEDKGE